PEAPAEPAEPPAEAPAGPPDAAAVLAALPEDERRDLAKRWDEVVSAFADGKPDKAADRLDGLLERVDELQRDGRLGAPEAEVLRSSFLAAGEAAQVGGGGDGGDDDDKDDD
ncbi:hypothetical protein, partial [Actinotalea ferrariae]|uniref:hypothetical protein n=1 Tax=Actinotalea ferrariae TaxID=1386098 RepID=UPI000558FEC8